MTDFVIIEPEYPRLLELLLEEAPSFGESEEIARLEPNERALPSVVGGTFKRYMERLHAQAEAGTSGSDERLVEAHRAIERLASSRDLDVVNALVVDVYEHLDLSEGQLEDFRSRLGPSSRALYDRWIEP